MEKPPLFLSKGFFLATVWALKSKKCWTCMIYSCAPTNQKALWGWYSHYMVKRCKSHSQWKSVYALLNFWFLWQMGWMTCSSVTNAVWVFNKLVILHREKMQIQSETSSGSLYPWTNILVRVINGMEEYLSVFFSWQFVPQCSSLWSDSQLTGVRVFISCRKNNTFVLWPHFLETVWVKDWWI